MDPGPPPLPPTPPRLVDTMHVVHALITIFTFGLWIIVWFVVAQSNASSNARATNQHAEAMARYHHDRWLWEQARRDYDMWRWSSFQHGPPPPPAAPAG